MEQVIQDIKSNLNPETTNTNKWDLLKSIIKNPAESQVGYVKEERKLQTSDSAKQKKCQKNKKT